MKKELCSKKLKKSKDFLALFYAVPPRFHTDTIFSTKFYLKPLFKLILKN